MITGAIPSLCFGRVMHKRLRPAVHQFSYGVFFLRLPLSSLPALGNLWFSINRFNLLSLHAKDHGPRDGSDLTTWVRALLQREGINNANGEIVLQTFPRLLGYVFNPITIWYCHDLTGVLRAAICEVSNTFGESHNYIVSQPDGSAITDHDWLIARKVFHVSPFCEVRGFYRFRFQQTGDRAFAQIDFFDGADDADKLIVTTLDGKPQPLTTANALRAFVSYPLMTFAVVARIHWQALKLWKKDIPFFAKPAPPLQKTTKSISPTLLTRP